MTVKTYCNGTLTQLVVSFDFTYVVSDYTGGRIWFGYGGHSSFDTDYTVELTYPDPLQYVASGPVPPVSHVGNQLTWYQADTRQLLAAAQFRDPRVHVGFLPQVARNR